MNNYQSTKTLPYVYRCTHKVTGEFYIGCRWANKVPSTSDLGISYHTSANYIKSKFNEFEYIVLAEFFTREDAYRHEQSLIFESWNDPLRLNRKYHLHDNVVWMSMNHTTESRRKISEKNKGKLAGGNNPAKRPEVRTKISESKKGKYTPFSDEHKKKLADGQKGRPHKYPKIRKPVLMTDEKRKNISDALLLKRDELSKTHTGKKFSDEHKKNMSLARLGRKWSDERKAAHKLSILNRKQVSREPNLML